MEKGFASISVVEPLPTLMVTMPDAGEGAPTVLVDGLPEGTVAELDWGGIIDIGIALGKKILGSGGGGGGGGGGGTGCTTIKITNPDGSSTTITQCPPPTTT